MNLRPRLTPGLIGLALALPMAALAATPGEITGVTANASGEWSWNADPDADHYNVYRAGLTDPASRCFAYRLGSTAWQSDEVPQPGAGFTYLVTGESVADGEGVPGASSGGAPRALLGQCGPLVRSHVFDRAGYGWSEWVQERYDTLGLDGFIAEQLDPASIDEDGNLALQNALAPYTPPVDIVELIARQFVTGVHARRQLEHQTATFWANHFNTFWSKISDIFVAVYPQCPAQNPPPQCDPNFPAVAYSVTTRLQLNEFEEFRNLAFRGNFRQLLEASALSPAMILYLDLYTSGALNPNENYPRELLELYALGVNGGYTQTDVEELSRALTGWTICKKELTALGPLDPCLNQYWLETPPSRWVPTFLINNHDCTAKTLFQGTPQEVTLPDTCATPADGVNDMYLALDAIAAHPSTARFISSKILERFVTDTPTQAQIDALVAVWDDPGNPSGVGDMRAVLEAALTLDAFLDPTQAGGKIKTPVEQMTSALRANRGYSDGITTIIEVMVRAQHIPHFNPVPTGWPERGDLWIGTTNYLERQNYGISMVASAAPEFGVDPVGLLQANGIAIVPGNADAVLDFLADIYFGGELTPAEREMLDTFISTDDFGNPVPLSEFKVIEIVALLVGLPQFQEQ